jgi:hypothetical protein
MTTCEARLWMGGTSRRCDRVVGVTVWYDETGVAHAGCAAHRSILQVRYPDAGPPVQPWLLELCESWTDAGYAVTSEYEDTVQRGR